MRNGVWRFVCSSYNSAALRSGFASCSEAQEAPKTIRRGGLWGEAMVDHSSGSGDTGVGGGEKSSRPDVCLVRTES